jgi:hypothetical protein
MRRELPRETRLPSKGSISRSDELWAPLAHPHYVTACRQRGLARSLGRLPTKTLERLLQHEPINAAPTRQQGSALARRSAWSEALAAANDDRGRIDLTKDRRDEHTVEGVGTVNFNVEGPVGMSIDHPATGLFKEVNVARRVRMAEGL